MAATPGISMDGSNFLNSEVNVTMSFSPKTVALYLTTLMSCVATVYTAKYSPGFSLHVFVALANWTNILLQRRLRSNLFFITNNGTLPVDSLLEVAFTRPSKLKPLIKSEFSNGFFKSFSYPFLMALFASYLLLLPFAACVDLVRKHRYLHLGLVLVFLWSLYTCTMMFLTMLWRPNKSNTSQAANSKPSEEKSDESVDNKKQEQDNIENIAYIRRGQELKEETTTEDNGHNKSEPNDKNSSVVENWCQVGKEGEWEEVRCSPQN